MLSTEDEGNICSFSCDFKVVNTEIKHKLIIPIRNELTTVSEVLNSIKKDIQNKFGIIQGCDIVHSELGETGDPIEYSRVPAHTIFKPTDVFYIRPIITSEQSETNETGEGCECPICYNVISERNVPHARFFQCEHTMCANCHNHLRNRICPLCRAPSRPEYQLGYEPDFQPDAENDPENMGENQNENEEMNLMIYDNRHYRYFHNNVNRNIENNIFENIIINNRQINFVN